MIRVLGVMAFSQVVQRVRAFGPAGARTGRSPPAHISPDEQSGYACAERLGHGEVCCLEQDEQADGYRPGMNPASRRLSPLQAGKSSPLGWLPVPPRADRLHRLY